MTTIQQAACARRFQDRVVLVTGVGGGTGLAAALRFGLEGAQVATVARSKDNVEVARSTLEAHGVQVCAIEGDVGTEQGAAKVVAETEAAFGRIDVLANTAGGYEGGGFDDTDVAALERMLDMNLRTAFCAIRAAAPVIAKQGRGAIVVTTAVFGATVPGPGLLAYNTSKAASTALVLGFAGEMVERNIRVNAVLPGAITHQFDAERDPTADRELSKGPAMPEDIAAAVAFLASEDACWITGATLVVDGGFSVSRKAY